MAALKIFLKNFAFWVRVFSIFCTYISEGVFKPHFKKSREEVQTKCTIPQDGSHSSSSGCGKTPAAWGVFGAMLLREDAGGYVLVAVVSFAAAVVITALCFRLRSKENRRKDGTDKPNQHEKEEKSQ